MTGPLMRTLHDKTHESEWTYTTKLSFDNSELILLNFSKNKQDTYRTRDERARAISILV